MCFMQIVREWQWYTIYRENTESLTSIPLRPVSITHQGLKTTNGTASYTFICSYLQSSMLNINRLFWEYKLDLMVGQIQANTHQKYSE